MRTSKPFAALAAVCACLMLGAQARAASVITGSTSISYNAATNTVTGVTTTELDYSAQDWYMGRVNGRVTDANGAMVAALNASDTDRDGVATATMQTTGVDQMTYTCTGFHLALADILDPALGPGYYIDYWDFTQVFVGPEGGYYHLYQPFYGYGPRRDIRNRNISLGRTFASVQARPRIGLAEQKFEPPAIGRGAATPNSSDLKFKITATTAGLQAGDFAVVEVSQEAGNGAFTITPGITTNVPLNPGGASDGSFTFSQATSDGTYTYRVRIQDIRRPSPTNPNSSTSIFANVNIASPDGGTASISVNN